ncbi:uncharacterized protein LOC126881230 [Diabrotica virgifera virgifera]|uniref:Uncharacterized protein n=1 Tax=Diabrotica virgifera virgifera TaxID=50390 RepID=A0ABM5JTR6_DIAVI|nr:uncharacterized protein LOC126881230 [Diabrotica virgifera virgifera]
MKNLIIFFILGLLVCQVFTAAIENGNERKFEVKRNVDAVGTFKEETVEVVQKVKSGAGQENVEINHVDDNTGGELVVQPQPKPLISENKHECREGFVADRYGVCREVF